MVVNPFQRIPGYIGSGIPLDEGLLWKCWILNPDRLQATEVIQKNCYQSIILVTWKTEMPRNTYSWQKILKIKLFWSPRDIGIGVCVETQNRGVERRQLSVRGSTLPTGEKTKKAEGTATPWQRVGSSEPFFSSGERCELAQSAKPERPHPSHFAFLFLVPLASLLRRGSRLVFQ